MIQFVILKLPRMMPFISAHVKMVLYVYGTQLLILLCISTMVMTRLFPVLLLLKTTDLQLQPLMTRLLKYMKLTWHNITFKIITVSLPCYHIPAVGSPMVVSWLQNSIPLLDYCSSLSDLRV